MTGLDPVIHAATFVRKPGVCTVGTPWMPGSSPGMTMVGKSARNPTYHWTQ